MLKSKMFETLGEVIPRADINTFAIGFTASMVIDLFGGWSTDLTTLLMFMIMDFFLGLGNGALFNNSTKTESGKLSSKECLKGLFKKGLMLCLVIIGHRIDLTFGLTFVKTGICTTLIVNETISMLETYKTTGLTYPKFLDKVIETIGKEKEV